MSKYCIYSLRDGQLKRNRQKTTKIWYIVNSKLGATEAGVSEKNRRRKYGEEGSEIAIKMPVRVSTVISTDKAKVPVTNCL